MISCIVRNEIDARSNLAIERAYRFRVVSNSSCGHERTLNHVGESLFRCQVEGGALTNDLATRRNGSVAFSLVIRVVSFEMLTTALRLLPDLHPVIAVKAPPMSPRLSLDL
jgi:hypothetical protein